jgi:hypothetical protein
MSTFPQTDKEDEMAHTVRLLVDKRYPAGWVFDFPPIEAGTIVPVVPASNLPDAKGKYWINTPELEDDAYGILLYPDEYEDVDA